MKMYTVQKRVNKTVVLPRDTVIEWLIVADFSTLKDALAGLTFYKTHFPEPVFRLGNFKTGEVWN